MIHLPIDHLVLWARKERSLKWLVTFSMKMIFTHCSLCYKKFLWFRPSCTISKTTQLNNILLLSFGSWPFVLTWCICKLWFLRSVYMMVNVQTSMTNVQMEYAWNQERYISKNLTALRCNYMIVNARCCIGNK